MHRRHARHSLRNLQQHRLLAGDLEHGGIAMRSLWFVRSGIAIANHLHRCRPCGRLGRNLNIRSRGIHVQHGGADLVDLDADPANFRGKRAVRIDRASTLRAHVRKSGSADDRDSARCAGRQRRVGIAKRRHSPIGNDRRRRRRFTRLEHGLQGVDVVGLGVLATVGTIGSDGNRHRAHGLIRCGPIDRKRRRSAVAWTLVRGPLHLASG